MTDTVALDNAGFRVLRSWAEFSEIEPAWRDLHARVGGNLFSSFDWLEIQESVFNRAEAIQVATLWQGEELISAMPLVRDKRLLSRLVKAYKPETLSLMHCQYTGYQSLIAKDAAAAAELAGKLCMRFDRTDVFLDMVRDGAEMATFLRGFETAGFATVHTPNFESILISGEQSYETYLKGRSGNFRKSIKRAMRELEDAGIKFEVSECAAPELIERVLDVSRRSWKHAAGTGVAAQPENAEFVRQVLNHTGEIGSTIGFLKGPDNDIAFVVMLHFRRTVYGIWVEFDEATEQLSPGRGIIALVLEHLLAERCATTIDFMRKTHFTGPFGEEVYSIERFQAFPRHGLTHLLFRTDSIARKLLHSVRQGRGKSNRRADVKESLQKKAARK